MVDKIKEPKVKLFDLNGGIEFGQRLFGFVVIAALAAAALVLHACGVIGEGAFNAAIVTAGTVAVALNIGRSIQKAAREKASYEIPDEVGNIIIDAAGKAAPKPSEGGFGDGRAH